MHKCYDLFLLFVPHKALGSNCFKYLSILIILEFLNANMIISSCKIGVKYVYKDFHLDFFVN